MTIHNICGVYVALERAKPEGGYIGKGATPSEAVLNCLNLKLSTEQKAQDAQREVHITPVCACG